MKMKKECDSSPLNSAPLQMNKTSYISELSKIKNKIHFMREVQKSRQDPRSKRFKVFFKHEA